MLLLASACAGDSAKVVAPVEKVEMKPLPKPLLPKPSPNIHDKNYTAPYPKLSAPAYVAPQTAASVVVTPPETVFEKAMKLPPEEIEEGKYRTLRRVEDDIAHDTRKLRGKVAEFIFPEMNDVVEKPQGKPQPEIFCYKSLADSTCYSKPMAGQEFRRVGKVDDRFK